MYAFIVSILLYMFPPQVVAKMIVTLFNKLAKSTKWTKVDDELAKIVEDGVNGGKKGDGQGG